MFFFQRLLIQSFVSVIDNFYLVVLRAHTSVKMVTSFRKDAEITEHAHPPALVQKKNQSEMASSV